MAGNSTIPQETLKRLDAAVRKWMDTKAFLFPDPTPSDCARRIGTTSALLLKYCIEVKGEDFRTWRTHLRLEEAKTQLLQEPDTPASVIARRVGINDRSNFSRYFREYTGMLPSLWREKNLKKK